MRSSKTSKLRTKKPKKLNTLKTVSPRNGVSRPQTARNSSTKLRKKVRADSTDFSETTLVSPKAERTLQSKLRHHLTPSPKPIHSQERLMETFKAYLASPKRSKNTSGKQLLEQLTSTSADLSNALQQKLQMEVKLASLKLDLEFLLKENKQLSDKTSDLPRLEKELSRVHSENNWLKSQVHKSNQEEPKLSTTQSETPERSMQEFKKKFLQLLKKK